MSDAQKQQEPKGPTRIPVRKIWLHEGVVVTFFGGRTFMNAIDCSPQSTPGREFGVAYFVPSQQVLEVEWYRNERTEPYRKRIPVGSGTVKDFD
jgi:hypothetical protein